MARLPMKIELGSILVTLDLLYSTCQQTSRRYEITGQGLETSHKAGFFEDVISIILIQMVVIMKAL